MMVLGYRIKNLRKERLLSQAELGKLVGVSKVSISGYESGNRVPSMEVLEKLINIFDISADYILGREVDAVCEDDETQKIYLSSQDINIIKELKKNSSLYNKMLEDPKRFFAAIDKSLNKIY